ncbi:MAG: preprotein translocase subunit SecA [Firmicutes bacterium]|nr:preprotein translocase subunit SecA [Bacillota bacterium]
MGLITKMFGTYSDRQIKRIRPTVDKIESLAPKYAAMSDEEMAAETPRFKERLAGGETLDDILPEAYALVREACDRVLGKRPFNCQLLCGVLLHQGRIAEMKTGEGKTIVAAMPSYLNALTGKGVHVVTVNEYLARIGAEEMGRVHEFLGLTTGLIIHDQSTKDKQAAYACDITYGTNNEMGFDYLRDNMVVYKEQMVQRGRNFAIVDEVDSILIDEARTPLIISGAGEESTDMYSKADELVRKMSKFVIKELDTKQDYEDVIKEAGVDPDYIVDEKQRTTTLTAKGIEKTEKYFGIENFGDEENTELAHYVYQALKAHGIMHRDTDYVIYNNGVMIIDSFTGRMMPGRRYSDGLHQAIEAKEGVEIRRENKTLATITFQNYFRMYGKLSGMTGTAVSEEDEFREIYHLDVVEVPTNKPMIRVDHNDAVYKTSAAKDKAVIEEIKKCHEKGQPVLVGTISIEKSEALSKKLKAAGIKHTILNAKYHDREAEIVAQAGQLGAVTISTNMAGRGTDILLGGNAEYLAKSEMRTMRGEDGELLYDEKVIALATGSSQSVSDDVLAARELYRELYSKYQAEIEPKAEEVRRAGGLFVIGTERHESRRIDNQLRGRSGRQGDPGESRFYISLEDDLMRLFGGDKIYNIIDKMNLDENIPIDAGIVSNSIETAQKRIEGQNFNRRKNVLEFDDVMNQQRTLIYAQRLEVLEGADLSDKIRGMIEGSIKNNVFSLTSGESSADWKLEELLNIYGGILFSRSDPEYSAEKLSAMKREEIEEKFVSRAMELYAAKEEKFGADWLRNVERNILLRCVDRHWVEHLEAMDDLRDSVRLQSYAQRNPVTEYRISGTNLFDDMTEEIRNDTARMVLSAIPREELERRRQIMVAKSTGAPAAPATEKRKPIRKSPEKKVGRNDPCPCGSGKKYKNCCGRGTIDNT